MTFTAAELEAYLDEGGFDDQLSFWDEPDSDWFKTSNAEELKRFKQRFGAYPEPAANWGGQGDGAAMGAVIKIGDRYFKRTGYYSSWDSSEYDSTVEEVEPYEKTVIRYRSKS